MSFPSSSSSVSPQRVRPPVAPSPPIDMPRAVSDATFLREAALAPEAQALRPDDASLDPLITALYLKLATSSRDDDIRLRAVHDLAEMRGHFARARVRAETAGAAVEAALVLRPELFSSLIQGLGDLGIVTGDAAEAVAAVARKGETPS